MTVHTGEIDKKKKPEIFPIYICHLSRIKKPHQNREIIGLLTYCIINKLIEYSFHTVSLGNRQILQ